MQFRSVRELLAVMPATEFDGWLSHYRQEPWGYEAAMFRMGQLCAVQAQLAGVRDVKPSDFYPVQKIPQSIAVQKALLRCIPGMREGLASDTQH